ncbi:MAG: hypothetical protein K9H41_02615 [Bacteroidia bacterium]|nr:hypothetical protein [Bacteroidia bacterium]
MKYVVIFISLLLFNISCSKDIPVPHGNENGTSTTNPTISTSLSPEPEGSFSVTGVFTPVGWNDEYLGNYFGIWTSQTYSMGNYGPLNIKDTTLAISPSTADSTLTTSLSNCQIIHYSLGVNSFPIYHGRIDFRNDSMFYSCMNGGLGAGVIESFKGKKL